MACIVTLRHNLKQMKTTGLIILILLFRFNSLEQELNDKIKIVFFNQIFFDYFDNRNTETDEFYMLSDSTSRWNKLDQC